MRNTEGFHAENDLQFFYRNSAFDVAKVSVKQEKIWMFRERFDPTTLRQSLLVQL